MLELLFYYSALDDENELTRLEMNITNRGIIVISKQESKKVPALFNKKDINERE